jgi:hypothetical protein
MGLLFALLLIIIPGLAALADDFMNRRSPSV